jgi:hypothetical protein
MITQIASKYVKLKRLGRNYRGLCPFHKEKTPSFVVNFGRGEFCCFSCGLKGNALDFIKLMIDKNKMDRFVIDAMDEDEKRNIALGLLCMESEIPWEQLKRGELTEAEMITLRRGESELRKLPIYIGKEEIN